MGSSFSKNTGSDIDRVEHGLPLPVLGLISSFVSEEDDAPDFTNCYRLAARKVLETGGSLKAVELALKDVSNRIARLCPPHKQKLLPGTKVAYNDDKLRWNFSDDDEDNPNCFPRDFHRTEDLPSEDDL